MFSLCFILGFRVLDTEDGPVYENLDEEAVAMVEETPSGTGVMADHPGSEYLLLLDICSDHILTAATLNLHQHYSEMA
nr:BTB/POZ domain-containing protein POB1-like isoform X1 [Ipomoea batatas]